MQQIVVIAHEGERRFWKYKVSALTFKCLEEYRIKVENARATATPAAMLIVPNGERSIYTNLGSSKIKIR